MINKENITGIILIGGKSRRMGTDKGHLKIEDKSFVELIISVLDSVAANTILVGDNSSYDIYNITRIVDEVKDQGPIAGICAGLNASETEHNIILSCDIPLINSSVLQLLLEAYNPKFDLIQLSNKDFTFPLIGLYHQNCLKPLKKELNSGEKRLTEAVKKLSVKTVLVDDHLKPHLVNINTREDLKAIEHGFEH